MQFDKCKSGYENLDFTTKVGQKAESLNYGRVQLFYLYFAMTMLTLTEEAMQ